MRYCMRSGRMNPSALGNSHVAHKRVAGLIVNPSRCIFSTGGDILMLTLTKPHLSTRFAETPIIGILNGFIDKNTFLRSGYPACGHVRLYPAFGDQAI